MFIPTLLAALCAAQVTETFALLKDDRSDWTFVPYTPEQRKQVAKTMVNMFSIYVNRESKIENYGKEKADIDAIPRVEQVFQNAANMTDQEFHYELAGIATSQRDGHLNYQMPAPHSCHAALQAVRFSVVNEQTGKFGEEEKVIVSTYNKSPRVLELSRPELDKVNIGDQVLKVDGVPIQDFIKANLYTLGGANEFGGLRNVLSRMVGVNGKILPVPTTDAVTYEMKSFKTGQVYSVTLPYVSKKTVECVSKAKQLMEDIKSGTVPESFSEYQPPKQIPNMFVHPNAEFDQQWFGSVAERVPLVVNETTESTIKYSIYKPESLNLGIIYMSSFVPSNPDQAVDIIRNLLVNELKNTNSVLFDIRSNGGGYISLAEKIPQFFAPNILTNEYRALVAPINKHIFLNSTEYEKDAFSEAYERVQPGDKYSPLAVFNTANQVNQIGQAYLQPVGVLTNGNCYSACDLFAASMQDNGIATIFGEDGRSGAGGANVVQVSGYLAKQDPLSFPLFPYTSILKEDAQDGRVSWRQTVRVGKNQGKLIEDLGIVSDIVVRPITSDLMENATTYTQYERIGQELNRQALQSGKKMFYFTTTQGYNSDATLGLGFAFDFEIQGMQRIVITDEKGVQVANLTVNTADLLKRQVRQIRFDYPVDKPSRVRFNIKAFDALGRQQVTTTRIVRVTTNLNDYLKLTANNTVPVDFSNTKYLVSFDSVSTKPGAGWNLVNGTFVIGDGKEYKADTDSKISLYLNAAGPFKVAVNADYDTELDYDFLKVGYIKDGKVTQLLFSKNKETNADQEGISGKGTLDQTFDVPVTGPVEVFVQFLADGGVQSVGATLRNVTITL